MSDLELQQEIWSEANTWIGTPYHHAAKVKDAGVDCAQLLIAVYAAVGLIPATFDVEDYPMDWHLHRDEERYLNHVLAHAHPVDAPRMGDVALFQFGRTVSLAAFVGKYPFMIHSYRTEGMCCVSDVSTSAELQARLVGFYRLNQFKNKMKDGI